MSVFVATALGALNLFTFLLFGWDKLAAVKGGQRVPEATLLLLAAIGGSPGALLARPAFRHKARKQPFGSWLLLIVFVQAAAAIVAFAVWRARGAG